MSQHQTKIVFKLPVNGTRTSSCGRFTVKHDGARPPAARWALTDKTVDHEVFSGAKLDDCREAALAIINATQTELHPAAILAGLDESWQVGEAKTTGARHASGDLVAWKQAHGVVSLEPQPVKDARRREAEQRALDAYHIEVEGIELELAITDEEPGEVPDHEVVSITERAAVKTTTVFERTGEEKGSLHEVPAAVSPVPYPWLDFIVRVYEGTTLHVVERRVYTRDDDTEEDIWRRCKHVIKGIGHEQEHQHQGPASAQDGAAPALGGEHEREHQDGRRRHRRPAPDGRAQDRTQAQREGQDLGQRPADRGPGPDVEPGGGEPRGQEASGPDMHPRVHRRTMTGSQLLMRVDHDSGRAPW